MGINQNYYYQYQLANPIKIRMKSSIITTQEQRYRSVKYKLNRNVSLSITDNASEKKMLFPSTTKYNTQKNRTYGSKFSATYVNPFKNDILNCESIEEQKFKKNTYMESFHFLLNMQKNKYNAKQKEKEDDEKQVKSKQKEKEKEKQKNPEIGTKQPRVILPALNELDSHFTVLDNINLPINFINEEIVRLNKELLIEAQNMKIIGSQLKQIQRKNLVQISSIGEIGKKGFEKLWSMLKADKVHHQEYIMKQKNGFEKTKDYLPQYYKNLDESKQRLRNLQQTIFKGMPFELEQQRQFELISSKYF